MFGNDDKLILSRAFHCQLPIILFEAVDHSLRLRTKFYFTKFNIGFVFIYSWTQHGFSDTKLFDTNVQYSVR